MNHIYRSIWNQATGTFVAVSENVKSAGKRSLPGSAGGSSHLALKQLAAAMMFGYGSLALAGPTGGTVVAGQAQIGGTAGATVVNQASQNAVINWASFNIGKGESVQFVQPGSNAVALNRVLGNDGTTILGTLSANGKVFIVNPNGVLFGQGASVNTAGLVASTLDISNADFMAGKYHFSGNGTGKVLNQGAINAPGGYVALLGAHVSNEGTINARLGTVALAAGQAVTLDVAGDGLLNVAIDRGAVGALVQNGGLIQADGGNVVLSAQAAGNLLKTAVNNTGVIEAHTIDTRSGTIRLLGDMQSGTVVAAGTLDASAPDGGNGGFIDTSAAHVKLDDGLKVTTAAQPGHGLTGTWLIDPTDFTIAATGGDQTGAFYTNALKSSNVTIQTVASGAGAGNINVNDNIVWNANRLTLKAHNNININRALRGAGTASLALEYGQNGVAAGNTATYNVKAEVDLPAGQNFSTRLGSDGATKTYTVITSLGAAGSTTGTDLQGMSLTGSYVLGSNLDLSATSSWNGNSGFMSIGNDNTPFSGSFDGLGHELHGLKINRMAASTGLFGTIGTGAEVRNLGLVNVNIGGGAATYGAYANIGALAGNNRGRIDNVYSSGQVGGSSYSNVGGLVGTNSGIISNSHTGGAMTSDSFAGVGGLVSINAVGGLITNSYSSTAVTTSVAAAAGLVGENKGTINNSYATGAINAGSNYGAGLVSFSSGAISNSHATGNINGGPGIGGLVGMLQTGGTIDNSYATGKATSTGSNTGGLVGVSYGAVRNSYATGDISGTALVGGVVGYNLGSITNAYASGKNSGTATPGGIAGDNLGSIVNAYFNKDLNPNMTGVGRTFNNGTSNALGLTAAQMLVPANYAGFNFTTTAGATGNNWVLVGSNGALNGSGGTRPMLAAEWSTTINASHQLQLMAMNLGASYTLGSSFSAAGTAANAADVWAGSGFIPVGTAASPFLGKLDGTGHIISDLRIAKSGVNNVGLFGAVGAGGVISSVGLTNSSVTGSGNVGALAGSNAGSISGSFANGTVIGDFTAGGLVGSNTGSISDSYTSGMVGGNNTMGGLVGNNSGSIASSYANANVGASYTPGGLVAVNSGTVSTSFWDTSASGQASSAGGTGMTTAQLKNLANYTGAGWELGQMWIAYDGQSAPFLRAFMQPLAVRVSFDTKTYDGVAYAGGSSSIRYSNLVTNGTVNGTPVYTGSAAGAVNAGTYAVSVSGLYATGGQSAYAISYIDGGLVVTPKQLNLIGATAGNKVYDGTTAATLTGGSLSGVIAADQGNVFISSLSGSFAGKNVGNNLAVAATATLAGSAGGNYTLAPLSGVTGNITAATINISGISAAGKVYDGSTAAVIDSSAAVLSGKVAGDVLTVGGSGAFTDKNAGNGKTVNISGLTLGGADAGNYILASTTATASADIAAKALTLTGVTANSRSYDGTTNASLSGGTLNGLVGAETLNLFALAGQFSDANVGNNKAVNVSSFLLGNGSNGGLAANYMVAAPLGLSASITPKALTVTGMTVATRAYDGTTAALLTGGSLSGLVGGETLGLTGGSAQFADKNAGANKAVTVTGVGLANGTGLASNYTVANPSGLTGTIVQKTVTLTGSTAADKSYDGSTAASISGGVLSGLVGNESLGLLGLTGNFSDKNAGQNKVVNVSGGTLVDGANGGLASNYALAATGNLSASITPKALTVNGVTVADRAYDGTRNASLSGGVLSGMVGAETLGLASLAGQFSDKNAGSNKSVAVSGAALVDGANGGLASNYTVANPSGLTATIHQAVISSVDQIAITSKVYDGTTAAAITPGSARFNGMVVGDDLALAAGTAAFADKNAGTGKAVSVHGLVLGGADAGNYTLASSTASTNGTITPKALTITGATAADKTYDGTTTATVSGASLSGLVGFETVGLAGLVAQFGDKNAGVNKAVTVSGAALVDGSHGGLASNYTVASPAGLSATINQAVIGNVGNIAVSSKIYDGTTAATIDAASATFSGLLAGDSLSLGGGSAVFADKNVGSNKAVAVNGLVLGGADAGNYTLASTTAGASGNITPKALVITGAVAAGKTYDGNDRATVSGAALDGLVGQESLVLSGLVAKFSDKHAGADKDVTVSGATLADGAHGGLAANYTVSNPTGLTATIAKAEITSVSGITVADKVYDGNTAATVAGSQATFHGMVTGDQLSLTAASAAFADKNAGIGKAVSVNGITLGGADAGNYTLSSNTASTTATIDRAVISGVTGITAASKVYDGNTDAVLSLGSATFAGQIAGDGLTASATGVFSDKNAGNAKAVSINGITLGGADAGNYTLASSSASTTANIERAVIGAVTGITAASKVYDGTTNATLNLGGAMLSGAVAGDALALEGAAVRGSFSDKNAGNGKTVTVSGLALAGADAGNYTLANTTASTTAAITPASLLVNASAASRVYDATTNASVTLADNRVAGDALTVSFGSAGFADKHAGTGKTVTVGGITLGGTDAGNYVVNGTATATATITQAALAVAVANAEKDQGRANPAFTASYTGLLGGDTVASEVNGTLVFATNAGTGSPAGDYLVTASGQSSRNYALSYTPGVLTVKPTEALQSALTSVLGTVNVAPTQGNMVQADMVASTTATSTVASGGSGSNDGAATGTAPRTASNSPAVQLAPSVTPNILPGLRLSVIDTGLRLPAAGAGAATSVESQ